MLFLPQKEEEEQERKDDLRGEETQKEINSYMFIILI